MDMRTRAEQAVREACAAVKADLSEQETRKMSDIIERAIIDAVRTASQSSQSAVRACCEADEDMAHKLAHEIDRANVALIANLSALR